MTTTTVIDGLHFAEAPRWRDGRLWFSDFFSGQVASVLPSGADLRVEALVPQQPSGLGWLPDGRLLVVSMRDRKILRREPDGTLAVHADLGRHATGNLNDMVVDPSGRAYVGNFGFDMTAGADFAPTSLHRVDPDGTVVEVASDLRFPNGSVITPDGVLLVNETFGNRVTAFDLTPSGDLVNRRVWASFGPLPSGRDFGELLTQVVVAADGSCLDSKGGLWVADAGGNRLLHLTDGVVIDEISPGTGVFACVLGEGTLFACAAPDFHEVPRKAAREGRIISIKLA
ncbi:SMP-30/gluconolactonase/LRE family protein [Kutzneria sp. CA-103260]|uniref:SMP-30/gluconolactonase/LRE family protein n=1 Tax=Kutzneria sp. CA-103260 TaxID=2802641 RepID=UPI001BA737AB|nr:SMP-30/gluconolactonase/LRE family protein [Kutzneria sp. CA-103260]QUQ72438.1 gluconolactonase [Kutzneria sp. CA-103260]